MGGRILEAMQELLKPYAICFAGVPGTSKSIISHHLSCEFGLPIFSTDNIRFEVREDLRVDNINIPQALAEYEKRSKARREYFLSLGRPLVLDSSMDRKWPEVKEELHTYGYDHYMIAMEMSRGFIEGLYRETGRPEAVDELDHYMRQHNAFMDKYGHEAALTINDDSFADRLRLSVEGLQKWLAARQ